MAVLNTPLVTAGSVTAPAVVGLTLSSSLNTRFTPGLPVSVARLPGLRGLIRADGYSPLYHFIDPGDSSPSYLYRTGGLAPDPSSTGTAEPTGAQATALLDLDVTIPAAGVYNPGTDANDAMVLGPAYTHSGLTIYPTFTFATTLTAQASSIRVLKGSTGADTINNIEDVINNVNEGVTWIAPYGAGDMVGVLQNAVEIGTDPSPQTWRVLFQAKDYGTSGNAYRAYLSAGTWTDSALGGSGTGGSAIGTIANFASGSNGSGDAPEAGTYRYLWTCVRNADGAETGPSSVFSASQGVAQEINIDGLVANPDSSFDYVRLYRTEDTGVEFFPVVDIDPDDFGTPDYVDDTPNGEDAGSLQAFGVVAYDESMFRNYAAGFPPRVRHVATWKGRVWGGGAILAAPYRIDTAIVTNGSDTVTFENGTAVPTQDMVGEVFQMDGTPEQYNIISVDESTPPSLTLDRGYEGTSVASPGGNYSIKDKRDPSALYCSEPFLPNLWPTRNNPGSVDEDGDDEGITGLIGMDDALIVFSRTSMYRVTGDDVPTWQMHRVPGGAGCVAGQTVVQVRVGTSVGIMWLAPEGVMFYAGGGAPVNLSSDSPDSGIDGTLDRINWAHIHLAHARVSQSERVVEFFLPLDDDVVPTHAIVFDLNRRSFSGPDRFSEATCSGTVIDNTGAEVGIMGDRIGCLWELDTGTCDGAFGFEPVQTISSATARSITVGSSVFPTSGDGLTGVPALVVFADGTYEYTKVASNTATVLTLASDLSSTPAADDQVVVGAIHMIAETGRCMVGDGMENIILRRLCVLHSPESDGEYHVSLAKDQASLAVPATGDYTKGDFTDTTGRRFFNWSDRGMLHKFALHVVEPGVDAAFIGYGFDAHVREK